MKDYTVDKMSAKEVELAVSWAAKEGWNPGIHDAKTFYHSDENAFFIIKVKNKPVAVASACVYDEHFAFFGFLIVAPPFRKQGYGLAITKARLAYIGQRNAGLDGVVEMQSKYARNGFKLTHKNIRYSTQSLSFFDNHDPCVIDINEIPFADLLIYDQRHFPAKREKFLRCWLQQADAKAYAYIQNNKICGYGVIRRCLQGYKIGPLFANNVTMAESLFQALVNYANNDLVILDIPATNANAQKLVNKYQMKSVFETGRMYLKGAPSLPHAQIYGITSFEFG